MGFSRWLAAVLALATATRVSAQEPAEPLVVQVKAAIDKSIRFLRTQQRPDGGWEHATVLAGGQSTLATLALLTAGVPPTDPVVARGLDYVRKLQSNQVYIRSLQAMVLAEANLPQDRPLLSDHVKWLLDARILKGERLLGWSYTKPGAGTEADGSNTQYAMLGLWAGKQAGLDIKEAVWQGIQKHYLDTQSAADGSWTYSDGALSAFLGPQITMTTAGVSGLLIAGMELNAGRESFAGLADVANGCGQYKEAKALERGFSWINDHFTLQVRGRTFYHLYGLERAGRLSGARFFGEYDWYREGCKMLVKIQRPDGSYAFTEGTWDGWPIVSTSLSLLFLAKGRTPVLASKLVHGSWPRQPLDNDWNNDRNDLRHLVAHASKEIYRKQPLAWQSIDLMHAAKLPAGRQLLSDDDIQAIVAEMLQSPILYVTGHQSPFGRLTGTEKTLLKRYVENGGFLLAEACCGSEAFDSGLKRLVKDLWPDQDFLPLSPEHPVWRHPTLVTPGQPYQLYGLSQGCRTMLVYSPQDLSCRWETGKPDDPRCVQAFRVGLNVVSYATGMKPPEPRLTKGAVASDRPDPPIIPRGFLKVAQLRHGGDWNAAPRAMRNLMEHVHQKAGVDVVLKTEARTLDDPGLIDFKFLYLHGRNKFSFAKDGLEALQLNLRSGGLLFADACCGRSEFDAGFRDLAKALFPEAKLERVPLDDPLFARETSGEALTESAIKLRFEAGQGFKNSPPVLEGIRHDGRWVVLYSKYDVGCALERHQSPDCRGYDPESALKISRAAVLYALSP